MPDVGKRYMVAVCQMMKYADEGVWLMLSSVEGIDRGRFYLLRL